MTRKKLFIIWTIWKMERTTWLFYPGLPTSFIKLKTGCKRKFLRAVLNRTTQTSNTQRSYLSRSILFWKVKLPEKNWKNTLKIAVGGQISIEFVNEVPAWICIQTSDFTGKPGEFSLRGGILEFSFSNDEPYRIEFFGNDWFHPIFDVETLLSKDKIKKNFHHSNVENKQSVETERVS
jgi:transcription-repair coupling factor (superfamily II helicase)